MIPPGRDTGTGPRNRLPAWDRFNREVTGTILLLRSTEGRNSQLAAELGRLGEAAARVHDNLLDTPTALDGYAPEDEFNTHPDAVELERLGGGVANELADRLSRLYRHTNEASASR